RSDHHDSADRAVGQGSAWREDGCAAWGRDGEADGDGCGRASGREAEQVRVGSCGKRGRGGNPAQGARRGASGAGRGMSTVWAQKWRTQPRLPGSQRSDIMTTFSFHGYTVQSSRREDLGLAERWTKADLD